MSAQRDTLVLPGGTRVRLAPGRHSSPREGVCVVELASLIAREDFSDRPRCVCRVIAAFLRGWNDRAGHAERQRLSPYAALVVPSRGDRRITCERRDLCLQFAGAELDRGWVRRRLSLLRMRARIAVFCGWRAALRLNEGAGDFAARLAVARGDIEAAFGLLHRLLAVDAGGSRPSPANGAGHPVLNGNGRPKLNGHRHPRPNGSGVPTTVPVGMPAHDGGPVIGNGATPGRRARVAAGRERGKPRTY
jgi:hypothetical protein